MNESHTDDMEHDDIDAEAGSGSDMIADMDMNMMAMNAKLWTTIIGGYVTVEQAELRLYSEICRLTHATRIGGEGMWDYSMTGGFIEAGWAFNRIVPYARYEQFSRDKEDPIFDAKGTPRSFRQITGGVSYQISERMSLRAEGQREYKAKDTELSIQAAMAF